MNEYTDKQFWNEYYQKKYRPKIIDKVVFADIFEKYLTPDPDKEILEIGCAGGDLLCFLAKQYHFKTFGVDYSDEIKTTVELFRFNSLPTPTLFKQDIFKWRPGRQFDLVCSFGLLEHFENPAPLLQKHIELLKPGGTLIITMPHFAHLQYFFHWLIDRDNLKKHNTGIMSIGAIKKAVAGFSLEIEYLNYYRTFGFWTERPNDHNPLLAKEGLGRSPLAWWERLIYHSIQFSGRVINKLLGPHHPNPLVSPHLVLIAKKLA